MRGSGILLRRTVHGLSAAGCVLLLPFAVHAATIEAQSGVRGAPGDTVSVNVTLRTMGASVAGTQNDLGFDPRAPIRVLPTGDPDCTANPAIDRGPGVFALQPPGCGRQTPCTAARAIILSLERLDPIPDGSVLYTCRLAIPIGSPPGTYALPVTGVILVDDEAEELPGSLGANGTVIVSFGFPPTPTPTTAAAQTNTATATRTRTTVPTATATASGTAAVTATVTQTETATGTGAVTATPTPTPTTAAVRIAVGSAIGLPGDTVLVEVTLGSAGLAVAATANEIEFRIDALEVAPTDCMVNPDIGKSLVTTVIEEDETLARLRFFVTASQNSSPIPDGVLYACRVHIRSGTLPDRYPLINGAPAAFDPIGMPLTNVVGEDGAITVSLVPLRCPGDCSGNRIVTVNELVIAVNIALGNAAISSCLALDTNGNGMASIEELIRAVGSLLDGCST
jgi:hypothetical protein